LGALGTTLELLLLGHYENVWQLIPLVVLGLALIGSFLPIRNGSARPDKLLLVVCALMLLSGPLGLLLHFLDNVEFEREMRPAISGFELFWKSIRGALPALAPGTMIYLGGLGLLYRSISRSHHAAALDRP